MSTAQSVTAGLQRGSGDWPAPCWASNAIATGQEYKRIHGWAAGRAPWSVVCKHRRPCVPFYVVYEAVQRVAGSLDIAFRDCDGNFGVQSRHLQHVGRLLVAHVPEAARESVQQTHGALCELVARRD